MIYRDGISRRVFVCLRERMAVLSAAIREIWPVALWVSGITVLPWARFRAFVRLRQLLSMLGM